MNGHPMEYSTAEKITSLLNGAITKLGTHLHNLQWPNSFTVQFSPKFHHILSADDQAEKRCTEQATEGTSWVFHMWLFCVRCLHFGKNLWLGVISLNICIASVDYDLKPFEKWSETSIHWLLGLCGTCSRNKQKPVSAQENELKSYELCLTVKHTVIVAQASLCHFSSTMSPRGLNNNK